MDDLACGLVLFHFDPQGDWRSLPALHGGHGAAAQGRGQDRERATGEAHPRHEAKGLG